MSQFLNDMAQFCRENNMNIYWIGAVENDSFEDKRISVVPADNSTNIYSCAKVFTVTAVGLLVDRGLLSVDERVCDILGDLCPSDMDPRWRNTTVDMVLRHRIGLPGGFLDIDVGDPRRFTDDYLTYMLKAPLIGDPYAEGIYTDGAYYLLSRIVEIRAGKNMDDLLREYIYNPLGYREVGFIRCPRGHAMGATGLYIRADDLAKLGALYMHGGEWKGQRILSQAWVDTVLSRPYELGPIDKNGSYAKGGMYGQMLMAVPSKGRAVAWEGFVTDDSAHRLLKFVLEY
jgi:CubicO group peptidase (beta-lactamase class C family)